MSQSKFQSQIQTWKAEREKLWVWRLRGIAALVMVVLGCALVLESVAAAARHWWYFAVYGAIGLILFQTVKRLVAIRKFSGREIIKGWVHDERGTDKTLVLTALDSVAGEQSRVSSVLRDRVVKQATEEMQRRHLATRKSKQQLAVLELSAGLGAIAVVLLLSTLFIMPAVERIDLGPSSFLWKEKYTVLPGDTLVRRGGSIVVRLSFTPEVSPKSIPEQIMLRYGDAVADEHTGELSWDLEGEDSLWFEVQMETQVNKPHLFVQRIHRIDRSGFYQIRFSNGGGQIFEYQVYEMPGVEELVVTVDYPHRFKHRDRRMVQPRRIRAHEGASFDFEIRVNKPMARVALLARDFPATNNMELEVSDEDPLLYRGGFWTRDTDRFEVYLLDKVGREDRSRRFTLEVIPEVRPVLTLTYPARDIEVSPLQELFIEAEIDYARGVVDHGLTYRVGAQEPVTLKATPNVEGERRMSLTTLVDLEKEGVTPGDMISWYLWAEDVGPRGEPRTHTTPMNYALVRSLDLSYFRFIGGGSRYQADPLIEVQQQIKDALWQIRNEVPYSSRDKGALFEDLSSISTSQDNNMSELERISARVRDFERQEILSLANEAMVATSEVVTHALSVAESDNGSIKDVVEQAHDRAGEALRALLKIAPDSVLLTEGQPGEDAPERTLADAGAGELDLDLTPSDDTYANETLAEMELSEAERETLAFLNRLRELARRQQQINQGLQRFTENLANAANESERDRLREELKRLADEQRTLKNEAGQIAQDSAQEAASGEVSENLAGTSDGPESGHSSDASTSAQDALNAMESSMRVAAEALEQGDLETAQKAGESASSEVERLESEMSDVAAEALTQSLVGAREEMDRLMRRQQEIGRKIADGESEIGSNLQGFELELVHDLVDQARRIDALMSKMDALALDAVRSNPVLARHIDAMLVRSMRMPIAASLEDASEALERGQFGSGSFFEMEARESMAALKESLDKAVASALGEELSSLELARSELDQLSEELREGLAGEASETSDHASSAASEAFNQDMSSGVGVGSGRFSNSDDWGERLRIVEELINDERSRSQVREAREVMETLFAEASRDDTMPQWDLLRQLVFSPLREVRYQLDGRIREIEGGSALLAPAVENPIPEAYGDRVKAYFERLGRE